MSKISVIIPCYNYSEYIAAAIESVISQLRDSDELIVVDDGSTDDSRAKLEPYISDGVIHYIFQENAGVSCARNRGAGVASGEYLYFLDADDRVLPGGLERLREYAQQNPACAMVFAGHVTVDDAGRQRTHAQKLIGDDRQKNFIDYVIHKRFSIANGGTVLIKRDIAVAYPYPESLRVSEDFCIYAWILANHYCCALADPVVEVRKHERSLRNQLPLYEQAVEKLPEILFDSEKLPGPLLKYEKLFQCNRLLSLFRAQYLSGELQRAKASYRAAIQCKPANIFKWSYLKKYLRAFLGR